MRERESLSETVTCVNGVIDMRERGEEVVPLQGMEVPASQGEREGERERRRERERERFHGSTT